jgi:hypothetical protein
MKHRIINAGIYDSVLHDSVISSRVRLSEAWLSCSRSITAVIIIVATADRERLRPTAGTGTAACSHRRARPAKHTADRPAIHARRIGHLERSDPRMLPTVKVLAMVDRRYPAVQVPVEVYRTMIGPR